MEIGSLSMLLGRLRSDWSRVSSNATGLMFLQKEGVRTQTGTRENTERRKMEAWAEEHKACEQTPDAGGTPQTDSPRQPQKESAPRPLRSPDGAGMHPVA